MEEVAIRATQDEEQAVRQRLLGSAEVTADHKEHNSYPSFSTTSGFNYSSEEEIQENHRVLGHRCSLLERLRLQGHPESLEEIGSFCSDPRSGDLSTNESVATSTGNQC